MAATQSAPTTARPPTSLPGPIQFGTLPVDAPVSKGYFTDREKAREASRKGNAEKARRRALEPEVRALLKLEDAADSLTQALLDAALGRGTFATLSPADRLKATIKALEYSVGRPSPATKDTDIPDVPTAAGLFGPPASG